MVYILINTYLINLRKKTYNLYSNYKTVFCYWFLIRMINYILVYGSARQKQNPRKIELYSHVYTVICTLIIPYDFFPKEKRRTKYLQ